ncbi:hypothetical protein DFP73DRAFT_533227 [Morchella snyderi]|nr:hypothetical protein DFP73DRAFT_533227 [Morchella snyderi]
MMDTATLPIHSTSPSAMSSKAGSRDPRTPRFHVDAFHSPFELSSHHGHHSNGSASPRSSSYTVHEETVVSPTAMPISFNALRESAHTLNMRIGKASSGGVSPSSPSSSIFRSSPTASDRHPALTIRRAPSGASLSKNIEGLHLDEYSPPKELGRRHHRRSRTGSLDDSPPLLEVMADDMMFPATFDDIPHCDEAHCANHHHRQRSGSIVSIKCDKSDDDDSGSIHGMENIEGEIETLIPMAPMAPLMLVPLIDRTVEMAELIDHRANKRWVNQVKHALSDDKFKNQCLPLWTQTSRNKLPDIAWLKRSKDLLITKSCGGNNDTRLWSEFCDMVGWSEESIELEDNHMRRPPSVSPRRHGSQDGSMSPQMNCIVEEED